VSRRAVAIVIAAVVALAAAVVVLLFVIPGTDRRQTDAGSSPSPSRVTPTASSTPTPTRTAGTDNGSSPSARPSEVPVVTPEPVPMPTPTAEDPVPPAASVTVTRAGQNGATISVSAFVAGVTEDGGTCTLELVGASTAGATSTAFADATTTICGPLSVSARTLAAGTYTATVSYRSDTSSGTSQPVDVEVTR